MNAMEFVLLIIVITTIGGVMKARRGDDGRMFSRRSRRRMGLADMHHEDDDRMLSREDSETVRLREEVKMLKERVQTLERIAVDKENSLAREIDSLRDR